MNCFDQTFYAVVRARSFPDVYVRKKGFKRSRNLLGEFAEGKGSYGSRKLLGGRKDSGLQEVPPGVVRGRFYFLNYTVRSDVNFTRPS